MATKVYRPLDPNNGQFRILKLLPAKKASEKCHCELTYAELALNPKYEALSYTWGGNGTGHSIGLNGQLFNVSENLSAALQRLRQPSKPRFIWIDAVCINQMDVQEKQQQLLQMKEIYEKAERVVIWLGEIGIGGRLALKSLAHTSGGFSVGTQVWLTERKFGLDRTIKDRMATAMTGEWDPKATEVGELAQLLDRPWWRRVWIVQEVVLAKKAVVMCGPDEVPWESIRTRMRSAMYGILGKDESIYLRHTNEGTILPKYAFPNNEHVLLDALQAKWRSKAWDKSLYYLMYTFRRFECTIQHDRIYAFLGLANDIKELNIVPDYGSPTSKVFIDVARELIITHKHLLLFNLKREQALQRSTQQQSQVYSLLDQARFFDPDGLVVDGPGRTPRKGWVKLPEGWERRRDGTRFRFYNHKTGLYQDVSPIGNQPPMLPQRIEHWRELSQGWKKIWDNAGRVGYVFESSGLSSSPPSAIGLQGLPSWVPNWTLWSTKDPEPFPSLVEEEPRYWASGVSRKVHFASGCDSDALTLKLTGVLFDKIENLAPAWCPEPHLLPIDRSEIAKLKEWEVLANRPVPNCPYAELGGRSEAFWRAHIADYAGNRKATTDDYHYFDAWANRGSWASGVPDNFAAVDKSRWQRKMEIPTEQIAMNNMYSYMKARGYEPASISPLANLKTMKQVINNYKNFRERIYGASANRAMFVTSKGFIGLAPWNAKEGDVVSVLFGGCTPFILRKVTGKEQYTLVGEGYVYGIMGGELFSGEMGHARLRAFDIV